MQLLQHRAHACLASIAADARPQPWIEDAQTWRRHQPLLQRVKSTLLRFPPNEIHPF